MMWDLNQYAENIALITDKEEYVTYKELLRSTEELQQMMNQRSLIFILCQNTVGSVTGYTCFINHHMVPLLLDANLDQTLLKRLIDTYRPDYLWIPTKQKVKFNLGDYRSLYDCYDYTLLKTPFYYEYPLNDDLALLLTTSGSTGSPKLVRQSYENVSSNINSIVTYLKLDATERPITTLPMSYTYGLSIINSHLAVGASVILTEKNLMQKEFWQQFQSQQATSFGGVPYTYEMLDKLRIYKMNLPHLRTMTQAGGKLSVELHKKFAEYAQQNGKHFVVMYGQTEATARMSYLPYENALEKYGSVGIAIPGGSFSLIDADGREITAAEKVGELVYRGRNVTLGYAECGEDLIKGDERGGVLITGDMAKMDDEGYFYIVGRKKRFLKVFGNRVNLDEMEQLIKRKFNEIDCVCTGTDDKLYIFLTQGQENMAEAVRDYMAHTTGLNAIAFHVQLIDKIPKNEAGKTLYSALEKYYDKL